MESIPWVVILAFWAIYLVSRRLGSIRVAIELNTIDKEPIAIPASADVTPTRRHDDRSPHDLVQGKRETHLKSSD